MSNRSIRLAAIAGALAITGNVLAQRTELVVGAGPFLTRDRGWNFENNVALMGGVERRIGGPTLRAFGMVRVGARGNYGYPAEFPPRPGSTENGLVLGAQLLTPRVRGVLYLLGGVEMYSVQWEEGPLPSSGSTLAASAGLGIARRAWAAEVSYRGFEQRKGTTRGQLDFSILRRLSWPSRDR